MILMYSLEAQLLVHTSSYLAGSHTRVRRVRSHRRRRGEVCPPWVGASQRCRGSPEGREVSNHCYSVVCKSDQYLRYANTDYVLMSALRHYAQILRFGISYDIACQYNKNLFMRIMHHTFPEDLRQDLKSKHVMFFIPKMHHEDHGAECQAQYSFYHTRGVGRTHGETTEQEWASINKVGVATRENGGGARHGTLEDHWGWWNHQKCIGMGKHMSRRT
jgi:hypothetical protein